MGTELARVIISLTRAVVGLLNLPLLFVFALAALLLIAAALTVADLLSLVDADEEVDDVDDDGTRGLISSVSMACVVNT